MTEFIKLFKALACLVLLLLVSCRMVKHETERSIQKEAGEVLDRQFHRRFKNELKDDETRQFIRREAMQVLDQEFPSDYRSVLRVMLQHYGKAVAAILASVLMWLQKRLRDEKKKNGKGTA